MTKSGQLEKHSVILSACAPWITHFIFPPEGFEKMLTVKYLGFFRWKSARGCMTVSIKIPNWMQIPKSALYNN